MRYFNQLFPAIKKTVKNEQSIVQCIPSLAQKRLNELENHYDIYSWLKTCTLSEFKANLYVLDILDTTFPDKPLANSALDVGSANWWYLPALKTYFPIPWNGIELPAKQRGKWFNNWARQARYYSSSYDNVHYYTMCMTEHTQQYDFITWFLPYVAIDPLISAGLPDHCFDPSGLLRHIWNRLNPGGTLFIINQGRAEAELQQQFLEFEHIKATSVGKLNSLFSPFQYQRFGWVIHKNTTGQK